eukprot:5578974-Prymnesium_polylepis.1
MRLGSSSSAARIDSNAPSRAESSQPLTASAGATHVPPTPPSPPSSSYRSNPSDCSARRGSKQASDHTFMTSGAVSGRVFKREGAWQLTARETISRSSCRTRGPPPPELPRASRGASL